MGNFLEQFRENMSMPWSAAGDRHRLWRSDNIDCDGGIIRFRKKNPCIDLVSRPKLRCPFYDSKSPSDRSGSGFWSRSLLPLVHENRWSISKWKSLTDCDPEIADRFSYENRIPIFGSVCNSGSEIIFQSLIDFKMKFADRFRNENRSPIFPERFLIGIMIAIHKWKSLIDLKTKIDSRFSGTISRNPPPHPFMTGGHAPPAPRIIFCLMTVLISLVLCSYPEQFFPSDKRSRYI